jgi:hypothetical protein
MASDAAGDGVLGRQRVDPFQAARPGVTYPLVCAQVLVESAGLRLYIAQPVPFYTFEMAVPRQLERSEKM